MQALMDFKRDESESMVGNEDMQEEIKDMLKTFHSNLLILQQVVEVKSRQIWDKSCRKSLSFSQILIWIKSWIRPKSTNCHNKNKCHSFNVFWKLLSGMLSDLQRKMMRKMLKTWTNNWLFDQEVRYCLCWKMFFDDYFLKKHCAKWSKAPS